MWHGKVHWLHCPSQCLQAACCPLHLHWIRGEICLPSNPFNLVLPVAMSIDKASCSLERRRAPKGCMCACGGGARRGWGAMGWQSHLDIIDEGIVADTNGAVLPHS